MTTEQPRDVAAEFMAATAASRAEGTAPQAQSTQPSGDGAAPQEGARQPGQAPDAHLHLNPEYTRALYDRDHLGHSAAVAARSQAFATAYPDNAPADPSVGGPGDGWDQPSDEAMHAQTIDTTTAILTRHGIEGEEARWLAQTSINAGLNNTEVSLLMKEIKDKSFDFIDMTPEHVKQAIPEKVRDVALREARRLELPAEVLDYPVTKNLMLGEHPLFIKMLARRAGVH